MFLTLVLACTSPQSDAAAYSRLIALEHPDPAVHIPQCNALKNPDQRGDCLLVISQRGLKEGDPPQRWCDAIPDKVWRAECLFLAAEKRNEADDPEGAAALCQQAAPFHNHCAQHLWQEGLRALTWAEGSASFAVQLPRAERLYTVWAALLEEDTDIAVRFWRRFYEGGFERDAVLRSSACAGLPPEHEARCRESAASQYVDRVHQVRHLPRAMRAFCRLENSAGRIGAPELQVEPAPELDAAILALQATVCAEGRALPPSAGEDLRKPAFK